MRTINRADGFEAAQRKDPKVIFTAKLRARLASMSSVEYLPERVSMLYRLSGTDVPIILVAACVTAFALWGYIGVSLIVSWFVWLTVASIVRYAMARVYRRIQPPAEDAAQWENYFCVASALIGAGWGLALMFIGLEPSSLQEISVTFLISSIAMGLPPSLAPSPKAFASFILPILAPMVAMLFTFGGGLNASTGLLMLVFTSVLLGLYLSNHLALIETLAYGHENTVLLKKLRIAEKSLTSALTEQQLIFDTAAVGIAFVSQGAVVKGNRRFAEILGYTVDEIAGQSTRVWFPSEEDFMQPGSRAYGLLARGENYSAELQLRRKDSTSIWVSTDSRAIDSAKPQDGIIIGMGDITERKRAEAALRQSKERLDLAMQSSAISIWEWDARRGTLYLDAALAQMTGGEPRERYITLDEMARMVHPDDADAVSQALADCIKGLRPLYRIEYRLKMTEGDWVWVLSRGRVVEHAEDGSALRMAGTSVDITQRKRAEVELLAALQREKELSEMKSKFVSIASHELRTPLATILSSAELLEYYSSGLSADDRLKMLHGIQGAVKRMNALIEDVLIIAKAGGSARFVPQGGGGIARGRGQAARDSIPASIRAGQPESGRKTAAPHPHQSALQRGEILSPGKHRVAAAGRARRRGADRGDGPGHRHTARGSGASVRELSSRLQRRYAPGHRPRAGDRQESGGVAWRHHRDRQQARSRHPHQRAPAADAGGTGGLIMARALLIDDDQSSLDSMQHMLRLEGHELVRAADATQGLALMTQLRPELISCDVVKPPPGGYAVLETVRANPQTSRVPVLLFSAFMDDEARTMALHRGATEVLVKPFTIEQLRA